MARWGQTSTQGGLSHCWQGIGTKVEGPSASAAATAWTRIQTTPVRGVDFSGAGGMLFSTAHAVSQEPQPVQRSRSTTSV
jgi:hypothetical protein